MENNYLKMISYCPVLVTPQVNIKLWSPFKMVHFKPMLYTHFVTCSMQYDVWPFLNINICTYIYRYTVHRHLF